MGTGVKRIEIPYNALVMLVGPAGSGKSTFARQHFRPTEIVSSDVCREMVSDDMENMACSGDAFDLFYTWIEKRLRLGRLTVADSTALAPATRDKLRAIAGQYGAPVVVIALSTPLSVCLQQNRERTRYVPPHVIENHHKRMEATIPLLMQEGYYAVHVVKPRFEPVEVVIQRDAISAPGFDVIGDIHGCTEELFELVFVQLGYLMEEGQVLVHPEGRKLVFVGDYVDRGPDSVGALRFVKNAVRDGHYAKIGNHDYKCYRYLKGNPVQLTHGLEETARQIEERVSEQEREELCAFLGSLPYYQVYLVPGYADLVVCHAGIPRHMVGRMDNQVRAHCLYGEVVGMGEDGLPIRGESYKRTWPAEDEKSAILVHGHDPVRTPHLDGSVNVVNVDQGCVFGGKLTAFRYPEWEFVHVPAKRVYYERPEHRWGR